MTSPTPHYLLFCDGNVPAHGESAGSQRGRWRFVLENLATGEKIEANDQEIGCAPDRSALTAVLRGLEALEQPSKVTLVTTSRYVTRGLQYGLTEWRDNDYTWEHFGAVQPIRNADIWKRIDRALAFHQVQCRWMAQEVGAEGNEEPCEVAPHKHATKAVSQNEEDTVPEPDNCQHAVAVVSTEPSSSSLSTAAHIQQNHKPANQVLSTRAVVATSKYQRVYVDTPLTPSVSCTAEVSGGSEQLSPIPNKLPSPTSSSHKNFGWILSGIFQSITLPFRVLLRCPLWLWRHSWAAILTLDEWLESFLRCLLLMEPSKKPTRH